MSRRISITARSALEEAHSAEMQVVLMAFEHPDLDAPLRLSSDPAERLSVDPLMYGTRSTWRDADPATEPFVFAAMALELPGDEDDVPASARIAVDLYDATLPELLRSFDTPATAHMAICYASSPDVIEQQWLNLQVATTEISDRVVLDITRRAIEEEAAPMDIIGRERFPGMFR